MTAPAATGTRLLPPEATYAGLGAELDAPDLADRLGRCYLLAWRAASIIEAADRGPGLWVVHGSIQAEGLPRIGHAWLEAGDTVYDPVADHLMPWPVYRRWAGARRAHKMRAADALRYGVDTGHAGPWHPAPYGYLDGDEQ